MQLREEFKEKLNIGNIRDEYYQIWALLCQVRDMIFQLRQKELRRYDITGRQAAVLFIIGAVGGGKLKPATIGKLLFRKHPTISGIVNRMEKQGLVKQMKGINKKNEIIVMLTDKGAKAFNDSIERGSIKKTISVLSVWEREQLQSCLIKLRKEAVRELDMGSKILVWPQF